MKKGIHPQYNEITVTMTDGEKVKMYSTLSKDMSLEVDPKTHSAWTKKTTQKATGRTESFNKKFGSFMAS
ncbi:MAG: 50S ribosomal protein L31 [Alphaproteobacteria bacterium]|nr:50S ribosomal protein L31 [Alphaproteobacteria bacterium]MBN2780138.1 50S ribosomal protein L31 [Alphaproteobacteria bacterium]